MSSWMSHLRLAVRKLLRSRSHSLVTILTLALGIGSTTAIFSVLYTVVLRPLPYPEPAELVLVGSTNTAAGIDHGPASMGDFVDWRREATSFEELAARGNAVLTLTEGGEPVDIPTAAVSANFFRTLGVQPFLGRDFSSEEETPGKDQVVILSHDLWQTRFQGDRDVIGRQLRLSDYQYVVVGVLPEDFTFPGPEMGFWAPMALDPDNLVRQRRGMLVVGRLADGTSLEQARQEMDLLAGRQAQRFPDTNQGWGASVVSMHERVVGDVRPILMLLLAATALVFLIAVANVTTLQLTRAAARQREVAIRTALGSGRAPLIRQLMVESLLLALVAGTAGVALARWGVGILTTMSPTTVHRIEQVGIHPPVLLFALGLSVLTGLLLGIVPALWSFKTDLQSTLKEGDTKGSRGRSSTRLGEVLIVAEIAVSLLLLIGSGLLIKSFAQLSDVDPGFRADRGLVVSVVLPRNHYPQPHQHRAFFERLLSDVRALPGVEGAATSTAVPMNPRRMTFELPFTIPSLSDSDADPRAAVRVVSPGFISVIGIPLLQGRGLSPRDGDDGPKVAVVNQTLAERYWPEGRAVDETFSMDYQGSHTYRVVGVVEDVLHDGLDAAAQPALYLSSLQHPSFFSSLVVRTGGDDPRAVLPQVKAKIWDQDPNLTFTVNTLEENLASSVQDRRFTMTLLVAFAIVAVILTVVGVYGLMSYAIGQRTLEIGIRMALGAQPGDVMRSVLRWGMIMTVLGVVLGAAGAWATTRLLESFLFGVEARDLTIFLLAPVLLILVSVAGTLVPARRAMQVDPRSALEYE